MKLHTPYRVIPMLYGVNLGRVVLRSRHYLEIIGKRAWLNDQRVITHYLEGIGNVGKYPLPVMRNA